MSDPILPLAVWQSGTNENSIPANDNALRLEALSRLVLAVANSPTSTDDGDVFIVGSVPEGDFDDFDANDLAIYREVPGGGSGTWYAWAPVAGIVVNVAGVQYQFDGSAWNSIGGGGTTGVTVTTKTASATLALSDGDWLEMDVASANNLTVPPNSSVAFPVGTVINVHQRGAGKTTIVAGSGVTVRTDETLKLRKQWATAVLVKRATDEWVLAGSLEAAP